MALLKFRCKACGKVFDELVSPSALNKVKCPECGGETERAYEGKCMRAGRAAAAEAVQAAPAASTKTPGKTT